MIVQGCQPPFTNATSTATAIATNLYRPPSRIMPSSLIDSEIASFTTLHHCEHFQRQLEHWKSLLRAKRVSPHYLYLSLKLINHIYLLIIGCSFGQTNDQHYHHKQEQ